jgi:hypothetical protein
MSSRAAARKNAEVQDTAEDETADVAQGRHADELAEEDGISRDEVGVEPQTSELSLAGRRSGASSDGQTWVTKSDGSGVAKLGSGT